MVEQIEKTEYSRKVDAMGRITIPVRLREQAGIKIGEMYNYSILKINNDEYLCIKCPGTNTGSAGRS